MGDNGAECAIGPLQAGAEDGRAGAVEPDAFVVNIGGRWVGAIVGEQNNGRAVGRGDAQNKIGVVVAGGVGKLGLIGGGNGRVPLILHERYEQNGRNENHPPIPTHGSYCNLSAEC